MSEVMTLPSLWIFSSFLLYYYLGWSFFAVIVMYIIAVGINVICAKRIPGLMKKYNALKDDRVKTTNESLNNIKLLKLHSWTEIFAETIEAKRAKELDALWNSYSN